MTARDYRVDRALIERVRETLDSRPLPIDGRSEPVVITLDDIEALCALAEDVLDGREALQRLVWECRTLSNYLHAPTREYHDYHAPYRDAATLDAILSHVTQEEPR